MPVRVLKIRSSERQIAELKLTKKTPKLAGEGELSIVLSEDSGENGPCYKDAVLYFPNMTRL